MSTATNQVAQDSRNEATHQKTKKGFDGVEASTIRQERLAASCDGPTNHDGWDPHVSTKLLAYESTGQFRGEKRQQKDLFHV